MQEHQRSVYFVLLTDVFSIPCRPCLPNRPGKRVAVQAVAKNKFIPYPAECFLSLLRNQDSTPTRTCIRALDGYWVSFLNVVSFHVLESMPKSTIMHLFKSVLFFKNKMRTDAFLEMAQMLTLDFLSTQRECYTTDIARSVAKFEIILWNVILRSIPALKLFTVRLLRIYYPCARLGWNISSQWSPCSFRQQKISDVSITREPLFLVVSKRMRAVENVVGSPSFNRLYESFLNSFKAVILCLRVITLVAGKIISFWEAQNVWIVVDIYWSTTSLWMIEKFYKCLWRLKNLSLKLVNRRAAGFD